MPHDPPRSAHSIFAEAAKLPPAARPAFLATACGADEALRRRIEMMLAARDAAAGFSPSLADEAGAQVQADALNPPTGHGDAAHDEPREGAPRSDEGDNASVDPFADADRRQRDLSTAPLAAILRDVPESHIGPYRLIERLGAGGFGVVFLAQQDRPVRRLVAIKVIKLGMDTSQVIARFDAERQALAIMDHPNIAKVFDAGATATGRPYFVMELVKGVPITQYCDMHELDLRQRLDLFRKVCIAVQHAHQKGVIHRDIKPSNVLVTIVDNEPVPKIIDFGIAKATHARLTERTMVTEANQFIGTPEYMSPEQAETTALDIDTRTDIYSLGVLLYELLTGTTPLEPLRLRQAGITALQRMICDEDAPRPSARVESLGPLLAGTARKRRIAAARLAPALRGDLDWIALKALEKDRNRRYDTAVAFAADIERHLTNRPVEASPPSRTYRLRKFVQRNRRGVIAAGVVAATVVLGLAGTGTFLVISLIQARHWAEVSTFMTGLFGASVASQGAIDDVSAERVLADAARLFEEEVGVREQVLLSYGARLRNAGRLDKADTILSDAIARLDATISPGDVASARMLLAQVRAERGRYGEAVAEAHGAIDLLSKSPADARKRAFAAVQLAAIHRGAGDMRETYARLREASDGLLAIRDDDPDGVAARCEAAQLLARDTSVGSMMPSVEREAYLRQAVATAAKHFGQGDPRRFATQFAVAAFFTSADSNATEAEAGAALLEAARLSAQSFGSQSRPHLNNLRAIVQRLRGLKLDDDALPLVSAIVDLVDTLPASALPPNDPLRLDACTAASSVYVALNDVPRKLDALERVSRISKVIRGQDDPDTIRHDLFLARHLRSSMDPELRQKRLDRALELVTSCLDRIDRLDQRDQTSLREQALDALVDTCNMRGSPTIADEAYRKLLATIIGDPNRGASHVDAVIATNRYLFWLESRGRSTDGRDALDTILRAADRDPARPDPNFVDALRKRIVLRKQTGEVGAEARDDVIWFCLLQLRLRAETPRAALAALDPEIAWLLASGYCGDATMLAAECDRLVSEPTSGVSILDRAAAKRRLAEALRSVGWLDESARILDRASRSLDEHGLGMDVEAAKLEVERALTAMAESKLDDTRSALRRSRSILDACVDCAARAATLDRWCVVNEQLKSLNTSNAASHGTLRQTSAARTGTRARMR